MDSTLPRPTDSRFVAPAATEASGDPNMIQKIERSRLLAISAIVTLFLAGNQLAFSQQQLSSAILTEPAAAPAQAAVGAAAAVPVAAATAAAPAMDPKKVIDTTRKEGEHELMPVIRTLKNSQALIDGSVKDYTCTFVKQERIEGQLSEKQYMLMKLMHDPFSVYLMFLKPSEGRKVLYVAGQNNGKMIAKEAGGFKGMLGKMSLDPQGSIAMNGQKRPITDIGIRNLTTKLVKMWEAESKFGECTVVTKTDSEIDHRPTTLFQIEHPIARKEFKFHIARLFVDNELGVPIHFDAFLWPEQADGEPPLEESYTYTKLKLNNGYGAREFDAANNPDLFK
jgi:hypothetical protein